MPHLLALIVVWLGVAAGLCPSECCTCLTYDGGAACKDRCASCTSSCYSCVSYAGGDGCITDGRCTCGGESGSDMGGPLRCGSSFTDANGKCGVSCPDGIDAPCPSGETCYASLSTSICSAWTSSASSTTSETSPAPTSSSTYDGASPPRLCKRG